MRFRFDVWPVAIAASMLGSAAAPLQAQSLADVARQEEARRKEISQPAKVYTNKDLVSVPSTAPQTASSPAPAADAAGTNGDKGAAKDPAKDAGRDPQGKDAKDPGAAKDQVYWSNRMKVLTEKRDQDQILADAGQSRVNALTIEGSERQRAVEELERLTKAVESDRKALDDLQEEARRASVPPGWLR